MAGGIRLEEQNTVLDGAEAQNLHVLAGYGFEHRSKARRVCRCTRTTA
jgi:hypothetical protein